MADLAGFLVDHSDRFYSSGLSSLYNLAKSPDVETEQRRSAVKAAVRNWAAAKGFYRKTRAEALSNCQALEEISRLSEPLDRTYNLLADSYSRACMVEVMGYRVLGPSQVRLSKNNATYDRLLERSKNAARAKRTRKISMLDGWLDSFDLSSFGFPVDCDLHYLSVLYTFALEQYRYSQSEKVEVSPGDIVVDGGGCWGDTALYFAHRCAPSGKVFVFEFSPDNLPILRQNIALNTGLAERVSVVERALWDVSDEELCFDPSGPATRIGVKKSGEDTAITMSIDDLVERNALQSLNFIKMDIEGAELRALHGAESTLRRFRPKLAITLYHRLEDFATIPHYLQSLDLGYRFFMDHFSVKWEETVMFAKCP